MNIQFYMPEDQKIPTQLRLKITREGKKDVIVNYERMRDGLTWVFTLYNIKSEAEANEIIEEIANKMCYQSYDHGQEWRTESIEIREIQIDFFNPHAEYVVKFRMRDSW